MRKIISMILPVLLLGACTTGVINPYDKTLFELSVQAVYPESYSEMARAGVVVKAENVNLGNIYKVETDASAKAVLRLPLGVYRISLSDRSGENIFNGTADKFAVTRDGIVLELKLKRTKAGSLVVKEIYSGGCLKAPLEGNYQADQYVIIHNNDVEVQYLDSLCVGTIHPYNSTATNPFLGKDGEGNAVYPEFVPIADAVWQFPGDGSSFPLQPGEDAVLCIRGAIDHSAQYPLSVNLNKAEYFVMYNSGYFTNTTYNPVPGDQIREDHILDCLVKVNPTVNATMVSNASPVVILYKSKGISMRAHLEKEGSILPIPGSTNGARVFACPPEWVMDAVECFDGRSSSNVKRLTDVLDAGFVNLSNVYLGHTLMRKVDAELTAASGFEVLQDTNNSTADFYETEKQSLHE